MSIFGVKNKKFDQVNHTLNLENLTPGKNIFFTRTYPRNDVGPIFYLRGIVDNSILTLFLVLNDTTLLNYGELTQQKKLDLKTQVDIIINAKTVITYIKNLTFPISPILCNCGELFCFSIPIKNKNLVIKTKITLPFNNDKSTNSMETLKLPKVLHYDETQGLVENCEKNKKFYINCCLPHHPGLKIKFLLTPTTVKNQINCKVKFVTREARKMFFRLGFYKKMNQEINTHHVFNAIESEIITQDDKLELYFETDFSARFLDSVSDLYYYFLLYTFGD